MSLLAWYPLIANGNNQGLDGVNLTVNGSVTYTAGKLGNAATFAGTNTYFKRARFTEQKNFSVSAWVKCSATSSSAQYCFTQGRDINNDSWRISFSSDGTTLVFCIGNQNLSYNVTLNTWYHVVMTIDNNANYVFYLNGNVVKSGTVTTLPDYSESGGLMSIGAHYYANGVGYVLNGQVQDFRYYNHALSAREVKEIAKGLCIHWKLDGAGANPNLVYNSQVWNNSATVTDSNPLTRTLVNYDGYNIQRFTSTGNITTGGVYTACFSGNRWNGGTYTWSIEIRGNRSFRIPTVGHERFTRIACDISTEWQKFTGTGTYAQSSYSAFVMYFNSTYPMSSGDWFEIRNFKVEEGSVATPWIPNHYETLYNTLGFGRKIQSYTVVGSPSNNTGYFGNNFSTANYINTNTVFNWNTYDNWEIYCKFTTGTDITTTQIISSCVSGCSVGWGIYSDSKFYVDLGTGSSWAIGSYKAFTVEASKTYYVKIAFTGSAYTISHSITSFDTVAQDWSLTSSTKIATDGSVRIVGNNRAAGFPFLGYVDMEEFKVIGNGKLVFTGNTNLVYTPTPDCSGYGNNGTINGRIDINSPRYFVSTSFNTTSVYTTTGFPRSSAVPEFTIALWYKPHIGMTFQSWCDVWRFLINTESGNNTHFRLETVNTSGNRYAIYYNNAGVSSYGGTAIDIAEKKWYHLAFTCNGTKIRQYVNGSEVSNFDINSGFKPTGTTGSFQVCDTGMYASYSDVRVYSTVLSADDIKSLYQTGAEICKNGAFMTGQFVEE